MFEEFGFVVFLLMTIYTSCQSAVIDYNIIRHRTVEHISSVLFVFAFKSYILGAFTLFYRVYTVNYTGAGGKVTFPPTRTATHPRATDGGAQQDRTTKRIPSSLADSLDFSFFFAVTVPFIRTQRCWLTGTDAPLSRKPTETRQ